MDPFSAEGELLNIHTAFHQGQFQAVIDFDTGSFSVENSLPARIIQLRAQIAVGQSEEVLADIEGEDEIPDLAAVKALALYAGGNIEGAIKEAEQLAASYSENGVVQVLAGTVLQAVGKSEEALELLTQHQGNLEAIALIVQIHLQQNRTDLALKEVQAARNWAQDSLLIRIAEAWVGLRMGGDKYQSAFYEFEEMAQGPSSSATKSIVGQAIAEIHLGRFPEAEAALQQAMQKDPGNVDAMANSIVLNVLTGKDTSELFSSLQNKAPDHAHLVDLEAKSLLFDQAAAKYSIKVAP
ncbi:hypothetical protein MMC14_001464 [Varicellaria rhodocarpa]|nr:hypothetical protein [Varicellaria rhodocarpa]